MYHLEKQVFEENITVGKYVLFILKTMQFCNCEICTNQTCSRGRHVVELSAITEFGSMMGRGPLQYFRTKYVPRSYFRTLLHTDRRNSEVFHDIYAKTGQSRLFF